MEGLGKEIESVYDCETLIVHGGSQMKKFHLNDGSSTKWCGGTQR